MIYDKAIKYPGSTATKHMHFAWILRALTFVECCDRYLPMQRIATKIRSEVVALRGKLPVRNSLQGRSSVENPGANGSRFNLGFDVSARAEQHFCISAF